MVSWAGDGLIAGYDPITMRLKPGMFHFATPGSIDVKGITRIAYPMGPGISPATYPNKPDGSVPFTFTSADFTANPGKKLGVGIVFATAEQWPQDYIPTPSEIFNASAYTAFRSTDYSTAPNTHTYPLTLDTTGATQGIKLWVLIYPSAITNPNTQWSRTNDAPIKGVALNSIGRAISILTNQSPGKPIITSPSSGSTHAPGAEFQLSMSISDPDKESPEDAKKYNDDLAGVQFQYRAAPTITDTDPPWDDLPFDFSFTFNGGTIPVRGGAWQIRGSTYWNGQAGTPEHEALISNIGCGVIPAARENEVHLGKGTLPPGDWQIRGRTFDYGTPYPGPGNVFDQPGALGFNPRNQYLAEPAKDNYLSQDTSPWSDPIRVSVPTQVPPPTPISPLDDIAVSGNLSSLRLKWNYRNTHVPGRDQFMRTVQIRKVGDPLWSTVFDGEGSDPYVDLPFTLANTPLPPLNLDPDPGFEAGTDGGWDEGSSSLTIISDITRAHTGNHYAQLSNTTTSEADMTRVITSIPAGYTEFTFDFWAFQPAADLGGWFGCNLYWLDADGNALDEGLYDPIAGTFNWDWPYYALYETKPKDTGTYDPAGWRKMSAETPYDTDWDRNTIKRHPLGVSLAMNLVIVEQTGNPAHTGNWRVDDFSIVANSVALDSFTMEPTNHYEWRVKVTDTDGIESAYSTPARFWIVPAPASGDVRPVPDSTIEGATLGCGTHTVEVYRRGGTRRAGVLGKASHIDWERVRDDMSTAKIVISEWDTEEGNFLSTLKTWAYEIVIWRDNGFEKERVWEGPITELTYEVDKVTIDAKDVIAYIYRRIMRQAYNDSGAGNSTTVVDRARRIIQNGLAPDDPNVLAYLKVISSPSDATQSRNTPAYSRSCYEEVDDMAANAGLDYTAVGRAILLWGTKNEIGTLPTFRDEDLGNRPVVNEYGMQFANRYAVSDGNGVWGAAGLDETGVDTMYGLVEMLSSTWASDTEDDTGTYTQAGQAALQNSFEGYAERGISDRTPPPVQVRVPENTPLNPQTVISIQQLVPGVSIPLESVATLRKVRTTQKLDSIKVVEENDAEKITITMSQFSSDDDSAESQEVDQ